jgi:uncharacterized membrane protein
MSQMTILERLGWMEARLGRVERKLGFYDGGRWDVGAAAGVVDAPPEAVEAPAAPRAVAAEPPGAVVAPVAADWLNEVAAAKSAARAEAAVPPVLPVAPPIVRRHVEAIEEPALAVESPASEAPVTAVAGPVAYAQPARAEAVRQSTFERTVGLKWAGGAGAIVMVIGAAMGLRFAYEQGMFAVVPAGVRLMLLYLGGLALLGAGEVVYRRVNKLSAVGLFGAGVATLFVVSYAGHDYFQLYPRQMAMALMVVSTLVGAAVAMRGGFVSIAVLSILGGHVAPIVLGGDKAEAVPLFTYLAALQVVALLLAAWGRGAKWWTLRALSLATTGLWMAPAILTQLGTPGQMLAFTVLYAALFQLELIYSNWRMATADPSTGGTAHANGGLAFSTIVTAALAVAGLAILDDAGNTAQATWMLALAAGAMGLRFATSRGTGAALASLSLAYTVQAAALVAAAAPVALGGIALSMAWAVLALAFGGVAVVTGSRIARVFSPAVWVLAVGYLAAWAANESVLATRVVLGQTVPDVGVMAAGLAVLGYLVARVLLVRLREEDEATFATAARALAGAAMLTFVVASLASLGALSATVALIAFAWLLVLGEPLLRRLQLSVHGLAVLAVAIVKWASVDVLANSLAAGGRSAGYDPIFNPMMATGAALAASLAIVAWWRRGVIVEALRSWGARDAAGQLLSGTVLAVVGLLTLGLSVEIDRAIDHAVAAGATFHRSPMQLKALGLTLLWATATLVCRAIITLVHRAQQREVPALPALAGLMAVLAFKYVAVDTLSFRLSDEAGRVGKLLNADLMTGAALVGALLLMRWLARPTARVSSTVLLLAAGVVAAWAGTIQIDSHVATYGSGPWHGWHLRQMLWTIWWSLCVAGAAMLAMRRLREQPDRLTHLPLALSLLATALAMKCLLIDVLLPYAFGRAVAVLPVANVQGLAAATVIGLLLLATFTAARWPGAALSRVTRLLPLLMAALVALLWGTIEIDRLFRGPLGAGFASPGRATGVAVSIYWAAFAIASVAAGFHWRTAALRYVGLGLFAVTLAKVFFVDLSEVGTGYRILSFFGLGLLLLGTSVLYGKLGPKLLEGEGDAR